MHNLCNRLIFRNIKPSLNSPLPQKKAPKLLMWPGVLMPCGGRSNIRRKAPLPRKSAWKCCPQQTRRKRCWKKECCISGMARKKSEFAIKTERCSSLLPQEKLRIQTLSMLFRSALHCDSHRMPEQPCPCRPFPQTFANQA